ncbi:MAG: aminotransferase class V-fold PLP-dependent enzyme, partial [Anaerolineales bacterium]|nr:aminotransferase class V-fold PLP-dependent enzyme [Anaerolineales bacterium]
MYSLNSLFLLDPKITFLNHGSFGATPKPVFREYQRWQRELEIQPVEFLGRRATKLLAESRVALGRYLGTSADNLVYTQNVTVSMNIVARSLYLEAGDEVLASNHEYGAMDRMWRFLSRKRGFAYLNQPVELTSHADFVESFWRGVTPRTKVIFLSHITSPTALIFPIREILQRAREKNIITIIDGAHVPGQIALNLDELGADFYGGNLHKWLCAPKGVGFLYARPEMQNLVEPLIVSWGYEPEAGISPFLDLNEWSGTRDISAALSVPAAIEFQAAHNWERVRETCHQLARNAQRRICEMTGLPPLHSIDDVWSRQMVAAPLPASVDVSQLKSRLY